MFKINIGRVVLYSTPTAAMVLSVGGGIMYIRGPAEHRLFGQIERGMTRARVNDILGKENSELSVIYRLIEINHPNGGETWGKIDGPFSGWTNGKYTTFVYFDANDRVIGARFFESYCSDEVKPLDRVRRPFGY